LLRAQDDPSGAEFADSPAARAELKTWAAEERQLEASLAAKGIGSGKIRRALATDRAEVCESLPRDTALIEYVTYNRYAGHLSCEPAYGAVILSHDAPAKWVPLGSASEINARVGQYQRYVRNRVREVALAEVLRGLYGMLCGPVLAELPEGIHRLIVSPDGALNFVSFATLLDAKDHFLGTDFELNYVSSGRDLLENGNASRANRQLVIFADPDYAHMPGTQIGTHVRRAAGNDEMPAPLPGTRREAALLQREAMDAKLEPQVYLGADASKANLFKLDSPYILHLATHGLYLDEDELRTLPAPPGQEASFLSGQPMLRSLLALAGASATLRSWKQGIFPPRENDGLLTAQDVAHLNLDRTWLVVLSACDTGGGKAQSGEGVLGLRRGFAEAGAKNLLLTLWTVDDAETADLMQSFYREALRTRDAPGALARVQAASLEEMRKKSGLFEAVHKAGPFILSY
jgi:CHAT domain-containing protein